MENSLVSEGRSTQEARRKALTEAIIALSAFCGLSLLSRLVAPLFLLVVSSRLLFPLVWWGMLTK
jgi:hypothetical protein